MIVLVSVLMVGFRFSNMENVLFGRCLSVIILSEYGIVFDSSLMFSFVRMSDGESRVVFVCVMLNGIVNSVLIIMLIDVVWFVCRLLRFLFVRM